MTLEGHSDSVSACGFSPDGRRIVSGSLDSTLKLWDAETGNCAATLEVHSWVKACSFSPDGRHLVSASDDKTLKLWSPDTKCEVFSMPMLYSLRCVAVHPSHPRLAVGDEAGILSVIDMHGLERGDAGAAPLQPVGDLAAHKQVAGGGDTVKSS